MRHWARCRPRTKLWLRVIRAIREDIYPGRDESLSSRTDSSRTISREYLIHVITFLQFIHRACFPSHSMQLIVNAGVNFFTSDRAVFCACSVYLETSCNIRWIRRALFANYFNTRCDEKCFQCLAERLVPIAALRLINVILFMFFINNRNEINFEHTRCIVPILFLRNGGSLGIKAHRDLAGERR